LKLGKDFYDPIVQPKKDGSNYEQGEKCNHDSAPPSKDYVAAHRTALGGMAYALATVRADLLWSVLHERKVKILPSKILILQVGT
jgi:hypothetical protein